jgi:hypothetical protein
MQTKGDWNWGNEIEIRPRAIKKVHSEIDPASSSDECTRKSEVSVIVDIRGGVGLSSDAGWRDVCDGFEGSGEHCVSHASYGGKGGRFFAYLRLSFFKSSFICSSCCAVTLAFANYTPSKMIRQRP